MRDRLLFGPPLLLLALASGCGGMPDRVEGKVTYRDVISPPRHDGRVVAVSTERKENGPVAIAPSAMKALLVDLSSLGFFDLAGTTAVPEGDPPPGSITVDTNARKFLVTIADIRNDDDGRRYSRAAFRVVAATEGGVHSIAVQSGSGPPPRFQKPSK